MRRFFYRFLLYKPIKLMPDGQTLRRGINSHGLRQGELTIKYDTYKHYKFQSIFEVELKSVSIYNHFLKVNNKID